MQNEKGDLFYPKVTIVIPVYNGANYMREAIDSALMQTYKNVEVLVVNDGSNDNGLTDQIALSYGNLITYYKKENGGVASALNLGIEKMEGEYFSWLSHDDLYTENKIEKQIEILAKLEDKTTLINCGYEVIDAQGNHMYDNDFLQKYTKQQLETPLFALFMGAVHGCSLLIHRSHFDRVGVFSLNLPTTQDYDLWYRMMRHTKCVYIEGLYVKSRSHESQDSKKMIKEHIEECSDLWINMISSLSEKEMGEIWGSKLEFLTQIRNFLKYERSYDRALKFVEVKLLAALKEILEEEKTLKIVEEIAKETELDIGLVNKLIEYKKGKEKRIVFILGDAGELGGLNRVVLTLVNEMVKQRDVFLLCNEESDFTKGYKISSNVGVIGVPLRYINAIDLSKILFLLSTDLYIESYNCSREFLKLLEETKIYNIKSIAWSHEFYYIPYNDKMLLDCVAKRIEYLGMADAVVWLNYFSASVYRIHNSNGVVIENPLTIQQTDEKATGSNKNILSMGRMSDPRKGLKDLLAVFAKVQQKEPQSQLYIIGDANFDLLVPGCDYTYNTLIKKLKLNKDKITHIAWTPNVEDYILNSRVHIMPSIREGFGLVLTECAEYGVPSIVFSGSGLEDIVDDQETGFICPQGDIEYMAQKVLELLKNDNKWVQMSLKAKEKSRQFDLKKVNQKWERLIECILDSEDVLLEKRLPQEFYEKIKDDKEFYCACMKEYETGINFIAQNIQNQIVYMDDSFKNQYMQLVHSRSWKLTEPLRKLLTFYKKITKN